jgi:Tfp pilus assembly protein PilO
MKEWFYALSSREQKLVMATVSVAIIGGLYIGGVMLLSSDSSTEVSEAAASRFQDVLEKIDSIDQQKTTNGNLKSRLGYSKANFSSGDMGEIFNELYQIAGQSGVQLKGTSQNTNMKAKPFPSVDVRIALECPYQQLVQFLAKLKSAGILLQPSSMKVQLKDPNQPMLDVQMTVTTYILKQPPKTGAAS